ncbi:hypothetical protein SAMN04487867_11920 [Vreelandella titanicae]|uniref:hypothetical protein n=1 Tax=Vreelandella titanicae TaxID=664683 RepID=UPI0008877B85|nr:hypothetical protein [Halomonas titanicae]SDI96726.1 hypothetical protein SAMN04487867_11920 [Halomonas titanicae]
MNRQFCFIGGLPRAGTRQFTDVINAHSACLIQGEFYPNSLKLVGKLLQQADVDHKGKYFDSTYQRHRTLGAMNMLSMISKSRYYDFDNSLSVVGFKSPRLELHKKTLDIIFKFYESEVVFFYCVRNLFDNYLSLNSMFNVPVERFIYQTKLSLEGYFQLCLDKKYHVQLLDLDDFIGADNKKYWLFSHIFDSALKGLGVNAEQCAEYYEETINRNSTEASGKSRRSSLDNCEIEAILSSEILTQLCQKFHKKTGVDLLNLG